MGTRKANYWGNEKIMASKSTAKEDRSVGGERSSFDLYRDGKTTPAIKLTVQMVLAARRWRSLLDEKLRPIEQSSARMEAMGAIMNSPALSAQVDIARRLRIEGPTLTRMLDSLEKDSYVKRLPDPNDRRTNQLKLTEEGEAALEKVFSITDIYRERLLDGFSEEEIATVNRFLEVMLKRLDAGLPTPE